MTDKPEDTPVENPAGRAAEDAAPQLEPEALQAELAATKDALLRAHAEMENLRRRTSREIEEARRYAVTGFARDLLEVSDSLGRAVAFIPPEVREREDWAGNLATGVEMTERSLLSVFEKHKINRVEPQKGDKFDHQRHQAMFEVPTRAQPPGTVAEVMAAGYVIADRLLRPAMVGVAKAPAAENGSAPNGSKPVDETA
jgi:molecular chaperone GrpE